MLDDHDRSSALDTTPDRSADDAGDRIGWDRFDHLGDQPEGSGAFGPDGASDLLAPDAPLEPQRVRVDLATIHPDRLVPADRADHARLAESLRLDPSPERLAIEINPGWQSDDPAEREGRMTNCADCARAFQEGLEGSPRPAARIDRSGLPSSASSSAAGEHPVYTEQWAGRRAESTTYDALASELRRTRGSAIVLGWNTQDGHAFNAYWDDRRGAVRWADAQVGLTGDWPPEHHRRSWPKIDAITFPRGGDRQ